MNKSDKENSEKNTKDLNKNADNNAIVKKTPNEPEIAEENLDFPGARTARPLTNDRHKGDKLQKEKESEEEPIENIELDTKPGKKEK
ncbi:hypothetical protein F6U93_01125 [Tamlana haliotis]|uniref:Uncharacterized protein n=1 Tax=Pseudotamlana haliotis TaxID=2614804 RepID=A0A6N6MN94_9FLAO|nr:hypothetical protein [Tamlana haliotis]KAB1071358.1 hypothetical protein F6U93_01125 [Tamlana haliotis]